MPEDIREIWWIMSMNNIIEKEMMKSKQENRVNQATTQSFSNLSTAGVRVAADGWWIPEMTWYGCV